MGKPVPATGILGVLVGVPLIAILLKEPLTNLLERKKKLFPEGESKAMFFVESLVELFDVVLSYATNSISFVRVGAFALSPAGMMGVVLTLAGYESGSPNWIMCFLVTGRYASKHISTYTILLLPMVVPMPTTTSW